MHALSIFQLSVLKRCVPKTLAFAFGLRLRSKTRCLKTRVLGRRLPNGKPQERLRFGALRSKTLAFKNRIALFSAAKFGLTPPPPKKKAKMRKNCTNQQKILKLDTFSGGRGETQFYGQNDLMDTWAFLIFLSLESEKVFASQERVSGFPENQDDGKGGLSFGGVAVTTKTAITAKTVTVADQRKEDKLLTSESAEPPKPSKPPKPS